MTIKIKIQKSKNIYKQKKKKKKNNNNNRKY